MNAPSLGGILATRQGSLLLALLCAVCAAGVLVFALGRYRTHVTQPIPQATVLVATGEIAKGTTGTEIASQKLYKVVPVTASQLSPGAISNAAELSSETVSATILPGQQITSGDFASLAGVGLALSPGQRAIEISVAGANAAADITNAGSRVDIYAGAGTTSTAASSSGSASGHGLTATAGEPGSGAHLLLSDVDVLKPASATTVAIGNQEVSGSTLVLAVRASQVPTLINNSGTLYLVLRPGASGAAPTAPTTTTTTPGAAS